jgi:hypothetical protein
MSRSEGLTRFNQYWSSILGRGALVDPAGRNRANHFRPKYSVVLTQAPTVLACRGLELDQLAEASWVRR